MNNERTDRDIDQTLTAWMDHVAPDRPPGRLLEGTFARTTRARQVRRFPWNDVAVGPLGRAASGSGARVALVALSVLLVLALGGGLVGGLGLVAPSTPTPSPTPSPSPNPTASPPPLLPAAIRVTPDFVIPVRGPIAMVTRGAAIWVLAPGRLDRIDPATNGIGASVALGPATDLYNGIAANAAGLWATDSDAAVVYRVDPTGLRVVKDIAAGSSPKGVVATDTAVWVADVHGGSVLRIDPLTNLVAAPISVGPGGPSGPNWLATGLGSIWTGIPNNRTIVRIDPATDRVQATIPVPAGTTPCGGIAVAATAAWISGCSSSNTLARVDPATNTIVATVDLGGQGYTPTVIDGAPWISVDRGSADSGILVRIDPATNTIDRVLVPNLAFGGGGDIVMLAGSVWVSDGYNNAVVRLPLTAFGP